MDPVTLIVGALVAGAAGALKDAAGEAVRSAYSALRDLVRRKFGGRPAAETALEQHAAKPDVWEAPLRDALTETGAAEDREIVGAAQRLMALVDPEGTAASKYVVNIGGQSIGATIGDHNVVTQTYGNIRGAGADPKAE